MSALLKPALVETPRATVIYPESDGEPMADNSKQFVWIFMLFGNLAALYRNNADVFVCGNQKWFPRLGEPDNEKAPDVYLVFGRPKGHRTSWKQWEENDVPMTVVFEVLSPKNTIYEMADKLQFYDDNGVEEYYVFDPNANTLLAYVRGRAALRLQRFKGQFTSPRLGIRFDLSDQEMTVFYPDGRRFLTFEELEEARVQARREADQQEQRADQQEQRAGRAEQRADRAEQRAARLAELSRKARRGQVSTEELQELERLEEEAPPGTP